MRPVLALIITVVSVALIASGCGSGEDDQVSSSGAATAGPCESRGYAIKAHRVDCETAEAMTVLLNGRARRQTLTVSDDRGHHVTWTCISRSIVGPLTCRDGGRFFTLRRTRP